MSILGNRKICIEFMLRALQNLGNSPSTVLVSSALGVRGTFLLSGGILL